MWQVAGLCKSCLPSSREVTLTSSDLKWALQALASQLSCQDADRGPQLKVPSVEPGHLYF